MSCEYHLKKLFKMSFEEKVALCQKKEEKPMGGEKG